MPVTPKIEIEFSQTGESKVKQTLDQIEKAATRATYGITELSDGMTDAERTASQAEAQIRKLNAAAAMKRALAGNADYVAALKASREAAKALTDQVTAGERAAREAAKAEAAARREAAREAATIERERERAALDRSRAEAQAVQEAARAEVAARKEAARAAAAAAKEAERAAKERAATEARLVAEAVAEQQRQNDLIDRAQVALNAMGRSGESAFALLRSGAADTVEELAQIGEELQKAQAEAQKAQTILGNKALVAELKAARAQQEALDTATMSTSEKFAKWLEGAENLEGALGLIELGIGAIVGMWNAWEMASTIAGLQATADAVGMVGDELAAARAEADGLASSTAIQRQAVAGAIGGVSAGRQGDIRDLAATVARAQSQTTGTPIRELIEPAIQALTEEIQSGEIGPALQSIGVTAADADYALAQAAREAGTTADNLTAAQRAAALLAAAQMEQTRVDAFLSAEGDQAAQAFARLTDFVTNNLLGALNTFADGLIRAGGSAADGAGFLVDSLGGLVDDFAPEIGNAQEALDSFATSPFAHWARDLPEQAPTGPDAAQAGAALSDFAATSGEAAQLAGGEAGVAILEERIRLLREGGDALAQQLATSQGITAAEAQSLSRLISAEQIQSEIAGLEAQRLPLMRQAVASETAMIQRRQQLNSYTSDSARLADVTRLVELGKAQAVLDQSANLDEYNTKLYDQQLQQQLLLEGEQARLAARAEGAELLGTEAQENLRVAQAVNEIRLKATQLTNTAEQYNDAVTNAAVTRGLALQQDQWGELLRKLGLTDDAIKAGTVSAMAFEATLRGVAATGGFEQIIAALEGLGGGGGGGGRGARFDVGGFVTDMRQQLDAARLEMADIAGDIIGELRDQDPIALMAITGGHDELVPLVRRDVAEAGIELEQWYREQVARARGNAQAIEAVGQVYEARRQLIERGLQQQLNERAFAAGVGSVRSFVDGVESQIGAGADAILGFLNAAQASYDEARQQLIRGLESQLAGRGERFEAVEAINAEADARLAAVQGNADAELAIEQWRHEQLTEIRHAELDAIRDARLKQHAEQYGMIEDVQANGQALIDSIVSNNARRIQELSDAAEEAGEVYRAESTARAQFALDSFGAMQSSLIGAKDIMDTMAMIQAEVMKNQMGALQAAATGTSAVVGALGRVAAHFAKSERSQAIIGAAMETARAFAAFARPGGVPEGVAHIAAAGKFIAAAAIAGANGGGGAGGSAGGGGTAGAGGGDGGSRAAAARSAARIQGNTDVRNNAAPTSISLSFNTSVDPITGKVMMREMNDEQQRGGSLKLDASVIGKPRRRDR